MEEHHIDGKRIKQLLRAVILKHYLFLWTKSIFSSATQIPQNALSCIELIFVNKPSFVIDSGVYSSLHGNCHYQILYSKLNLNIQYLPPYERLVWDDKNSVSKVINKAIAGFGLKKSFQKKNAHRQSLFNYTFLQTIEIFELNLKISSQKFVWHLLTKRKNDKTKKKR